MTKLPTFDQIYKKEIAQGKEVEDQIEEYRQKCFDESKSSTKTVEALRKMHVFDAVVWADQYVLTASAEGLSVKDDMFPDDYRMYFVDRKTGKTREISASEMQLFRDDNGQPFNTTALKKVPFNNLEIG